MRDPVREQFATARRSQILDAALRLFADRGFAATTIRDIAREAGSADGTVYLYFENKAALLLGILERMREGVAHADDLPQVDADDPRAFLRTYLRYPLAAPRADDFALFRVILSEIMINDAMRDRYRREVLTPNAAAVEAALRRWADRHRLAGFDVALLTRVLSAAVLGLIAARIAGDEVLAARWDDLPDLLADLFVRGLAGPGAEEPGRAASALG